MIELSPTLVRQFRAILRKSVLAADSRGSSALVVCRAGRGGLHVTCQQGDIGLCHFTPGSFPADCIAVPVRVLNELTKVSQTITLEQPAPFKGKASWQTEEGPQVIDFETVDPVSLPPATLEPARNGAGMPPNFLPCLDDAARTANRESARFALSQILLQGSDGAIIASDGRQMLIQAGFQSPWKENRFLPALPVFGCKELPREQDVWLGGKDDTITLQVGPWLLTFKSAPNLKYPDVNRVIPSSRGNTRLRLDPQDVEELTLALPRLPGHDEPDQPITLDLREKVVVRARDQQGRIEEVPLLRSRAEGRPVQIATRRSYLERALKLGFRELRIARPDAPLVCRDATRTYLWMPLAEEDAVPPVDGIHADGNGSNNEAAALNPEPPKRTNVMPGNGFNANEQPIGNPGQGEPPDPLVDAEALRAELQEALTRTNRLIATLKHQRRQNRALQAAAASLLRLQPNGG